MDIEKVIDVLEATVEHGICVPKEVEILMGEIKAERADVLSRCMAFAKHVASQRQDDFGGHPTNVQLAIDLVEALSAHYGRVPSKRQVNRPYIRTPEERSEQARRASLARWGKRHNTTGDDQ